MVFSSRDDKSFFVSSVLLPKKKNPKTQHFLTSAVCSDAEILDKLQTVNKLLTFQTVRPSANKFFTCNLYFIAI